MYLKTIMVACFCAGQFLHKNWIMNLITILLVGLGKASQGISTALSVEKTSKRGGKIVNLAAEQGTLLVYLQSE